MSSKGSDTESTISGWREAFADALDSNAAPVLKLRGNAAPSGSVAVSDAAPSGSSPERCASYEAAAAKLKWLPEAMQAVSFGVQEFQRLSQLLGKEAAAQVVLLMLARRKQQNSSFQLQDIAHLPRQLRFTGLNKLEQVYNGCFPMPPILENVPRLAPGTFDDSDSVIGDTTRSVS